MKLSVKEILQATGGALRGGDEKGIVRGISTDTRTLQKGDLYVALKGPRYDGHDFVEQAMDQGACGVLVSCELKAEFFFIRVSDTLKALGDMARYWRRRFSIPVVAMTGSSGKTSTKDMLASCLEQSGAVCKTEGNLNNLIGLPLTIFSLDQKHDYAVFEMGMNAFGEIARLTEIATPTIGLITNVGRAHLEGVGDIEGVAKAKGELFSGLDEKAVAVINADDPYIVGMKTNARRFLFGFSKKGDVCCAKVDRSSEVTRVTIFHEKREQVFELPLLGEHYIRNFLACYAVCALLGLSPQMVQRGIKSFKHSKMRGEEIRLHSGMLVVDDAYNANPDSMEAALRAFSARFPNRRKVAILGEMLELGGETASLHHFVGERAKASGVNLLIAYGRWAGEMNEGFGKQANTFDDITQLNKCLKGLLQKEDAVLVKGSRGSQMERVVDFLKENF